MVVRPLKGFGAFSAASLAGRRFTCGPLSMTVVISPDRPVPPSVDVGVSIAKRYAPHAVTRTRMRRLLREAARRVIRRHQGPVTEARMTTLLLVWRSTPPTSPRLTLGEVERVVDEAMQRAVSALVEKTV